MLTVYGRATSSNVQPVMWLIGELGLAHERRDLGHAFGGLETPEFRALNPNGLIPVLRDGDLVVWESCAILRYLAARYGAGALWPEEPAARAPIDMWAEWGKTTLTQGFNMPIFWQLVRIPPSRRDSAAVAAALARLEPVLDILEQQLGAGPHVLGPDFTLADIVIGHVLYRYYTVEIPRRERPALARYYATLQARPAYREHVMVSWEPIRAKEAS
ncbi:glutathione S-transferase C-terminal domain-containing protein [Rhodobacteraceae bacterium DSL-40]|uniref:glutathione S-transferase family protein n=1 Tax=Amaricoccus sp. B4 TaxID=3368557 RepID=UPI000DACF80C